jgi:hypothetical protein
VCPKRCNACHTVCPPDAFADHGEFNKTKCMHYCIKHAIYPIAFKDEQGLKQEGGLSIQPDIITG